MTTDDVLRVEDGRGGKLNRQTEIVTAGETIMLHRRRHGWSQRDLARESGLSNTYIALLESGQSINPTVKTIMALARALNDVIGWGLYIQFETELYRDGLREEAEREDAEERQLEGG